jgi:hypothetical protein
VRKLLLLAGLASAAPVRAQTPVAPALMDYAATALARLIESQRERAIADGVRPMPPAAYRGLLGYFPPALLQRVRWATGRTGVISLPSLAFTYGDAAAITLGDLVLFRNDRQAHDDLKLWAHELTHVMQYQRWGIDGFASRYVGDRAGVEREAVDNAERFVKWRAQGDRSASR